MANELEPKSAITAADKVKNFQLVFQSNSTDGWGKYWEEGLTPWELGSPTPVLVHLHNTGSLPKGRALIPGCGSGYDVVAIACAERHVVGLDVSDNAIKKAIQLCDVVVVIWVTKEPQSSSLWARKMSDPLKPDGELITLMYPIDDHEGGPPFRVSVADYEEVLHPFGFKATHVSENELAIGPRKGWEKLGRWKRSICQSSLL